MEPFRYHVYVCEQVKPDGAPCCAARGAPQVIEELRRQISAQGLGEQVQVTTCGSLGLCERGPNMVVYPEGIWYSGVQVRDVAEIVRQHFGQGLPVMRLANTDSAAVRAEINENKRRRLAALKAQEAAGQLPEDLNQRIRGFQESRALLSAIELDVFSAIGTGATAGEVAAKLGTDARATEMLLNAVAALGALTKHDGVFQNTPAARLIESRQALMHIVHLWPRWSTLTECVRAGTAVAASQRSEDWTEPFIAAMHHNARARAALVVQAVGAGAVRRMLDVGGGSGAYSIAFAQANPELRADILDLPAVVPIATRHIREAGLEDRVAVRPGDLTADPLGAAYDLVFISAICHMLGPEGNRDLLRRSFEALAPGGRAVVQDFILESDKTAPRMAALFALNMLVGTREGSSYSEPEYAEWLGKAGFADVRRIRLPGPTGLMVGVRPPV